MSINREHMVRIIGGKNKGKLLPVIDAKGLRPTPDRIRETLFSWLGNNINGAKVLDLFAGSGALGFESLSRGAQSATLIELNKDNYKNLKKISNDIQNLQVINEDALHYLENCNERFDVVFIDPPYDSNLRIKALNILKQRNLLSEKALIYVEMRAGSSETVLGYRIIKSDIAGQVKFTLWELSKLDF